MSRLVIFGAGGCGRDAFVAAREIAGAVFADDHPSEADVIGANAIANDDMIVVAIGDGDIRRRVAARFDRFGSIKAPTVVIGPDVAIGPGSILADFSMVSTRSRIGQHFQMNAYSHIMHDCIVGDYVTLASHVAVNGNTVIGDGVTIGCGAKIRNGVPGCPIVVGEGAVIGMGAVVTKSVAPHTTVVGNPARVIQQPRLRVA